MINNNNFVYNLYVNNNVLLRNFSGYVLKEKLLVYLFEQLKRRERIELLIYFTWNGRTQ